MAATVVVQGMHKGPHLRFDHPAQTEGKNCHVVERFFGRRRRRERDGVLLSCPSVSFDCPQREEREERGAGVHKWQRREDERVGLLSGSFSADSPFGRLRHQTTTGREGRD